MYPNITKIAELIYMNLTRVIGVYSQITEELVTAFKIGHIPLYQLRGIL